VKPCDVVVGWSSEMLVFYRYTTQCQKLRWRQQGPSKRRYTFTTLHCVTIQKSSN